MWSPFYPLNVWDSLSEFEIIQVASQDTIERIIECTFHVRNPITQEMNIGIELSCQQSVLISDLDEQVSSVEVFFFNDTNNNLVQIIARGSATSIEQMCDNSYDLVNRILSDWTIQTAAPSQIYKIEVLDTKHNAKWEIRESVVTPRYTFQLGKYLDAFPPLKSMKSLYREGRNSASIYYRFLCFFKIIDKCPNAISLMPEIRRQLGANTPPYTPFIISQEMIDRADLHKTGKLDCFLDKKAGFFRDEITNVRNRIAHFIIDDDVLDFDKIEEYITIAEIVNLADIIAYELIRHETTYLTTVELVMQQSTKNQ